MNHHFLFSNLDDSLDSSSTFSEYSFNAPPFSPMCATSSLSFQLNPPSALLLDYVIQEDKKQTTRSIVVTLG